MSNNRPVFRIAFKHKQTREWENDREVPCWPHPENPAIAPNVRFPAGTTITFPDGKVMKLDEYWVNLQKVEAKPSQPDF